MDWRKLIVPLGILILNVIVKILFIDATPIGGDEPFTLYYAQQDYGSLFEMFESENNPPLYTLLMKYWIQFFGNGTASVRILPLVFSSLAAVVVYKIGRSFYSNFTGIVASLIFTFSSYHIYFAHESRPYALFALLTGLSILLFMQVTLEKRKQRIYLLALVNILLIYTHFFGFFVLFIQFICFITIRPIRKESWKPLFIAWGISALGYLPYIPLFLKRFSHASASGGTFLAPPTFASLYDNLAKFANQPVTTVLFLTVLVVGLVLWIIQKERKMKPPYLILVIWFLVPYLLMFTLSAKVPMFLDRYLVYISIAFYLLIAVTADGLFKQVKIRLGLGVLLVGLMVATCDFKAGNSRSDDAFVAEIILKKHENTAVILCPDWYFMTFTYHYDRAYFNDYQHTYERLEEDAIYPRNFLNSTDKLEISSKDEIIYVNTGATFGDPEGTIEALLMQDYDLIEVDERFLPFTLVHYIRKKK